VLLTASEFLTFPLWLAPHCSPPLACSSQEVSFWLFPCDWPLTAHLPWRALYSEWVSDFSLMIGPLQLTSLGVLFTASEFLTFPLWLAPHSSPPLACSSQQVSFLLFPCDWPLTAHLPWRALYSEWVSDFSLVIGPSQLTSLGVLFALHRKWVSYFSLMIGPSQLTSLGVLFTGSEFLTFSLWLAPHCSSPLVCSSQQVSFLLFPCDWPLTAHLPWHALYRKWVSDFSLMIGPSQLTSLGMLFTGSEFLTFPLWLASYSLPSLWCSLQQVSLWYLYANSSSNCFWYIEYVYLN
jgi:hypothetical protein